MKWFVAGLFSIWCAVNCYARQDPAYFDRDFYLRVDNDAFLAMKVDRYYSSGIFFRFRKAVKPGSFLAKTGLKSVYSVNFSHLFFTPSDLKLRTIDQFDRPYAGLMSGGFGIAYFSGKSHFKLQLDAGVMGPSAKVRELQEWYHRLIGAKKPRGWRFQIEDSPLLTLNLEYLRTFFRRKKVEMLTGASLQAGTIFNNIRPGLVFRFGNFNDIANTQLNQSRLGVIEKQGTGDKRHKESFFFLKTNMEYVAYDATIEGDLFGSESLHTETAQPWRYRIAYGYMLGLRRWDFTLAFNNVRRETKESRDHYYVTIDVIMRF